MPDKPDNPDNFVLKSVSLGSVDSRKRPLRLFHSGGTVGPLEATAGKEQLRPAAARVGARELDPLGPRPGRRRKPATWA